MTQGPNPTTAAASNRGNSIASLLLGTGTSGSLIQSFKDVAATAVHRAVFPGRLARHQTPHVQPGHSLRPGYPADRALRPDELLRPGDRVAAGPRFPAISNLKGGLVFVGVERTAAHRSTITDTNNVAPRFGFAYQVTPKTAIRGGFGNIFAISLQQAHGTVGPFGFRTQTPGCAQWTASRPTTCSPIRSRAGSVAITGSILGAVDAGGRQHPGAGPGDADAVFHAVELQRAAALPADIVLEVAYVGTRGLQLSRNDEGGLA